MRNGAFYETSNSLAFLVCGTRSGWMQYDTDSSGCPKSWAEIRLVPASLHAKGSREVAILVGEV